MVKEKLLFLGRLSNLPPELLDRRAMRFEFKNVLECSAKNTPIPFNEPL